MKAQANTTVAQNLAAKALGKKAPLTSKQAAPIMQEPKAIEVDEDTIKTQWTTALTRYASAEEALKSAYVNARLIIAGEKPKNGFSFAKKKLIRKTLIKWATDAGIVLGTAENVVSRAMKDHGDQIRESRKEKISPEVDRAAKALLKFGVDNIKHDILAKAMSVARERALDIIKEEKAEMAAAE